MRVKDEHNDKKLIGGIVGVRTRIFICSKTKA